MSPIKAFIFDWAGTMVDFGSVAPVRALKNLFSEEGLALSEAEARADMGMAKRAHIKSILDREPLRSQWVERHGGAVTEADLDRLMNVLQPHMLRAAADTADLIPGAGKVAELLTTKGIRIASGTGYSRDMMQAILPRAAAQGYAPEVVICAGETAEGRPSPLMTWKAMVELGTWPARACIKVDDAIVGIQEGREAGVWTIGVAASGNGVGLDLNDFTTLSPDVRSVRIATAAKALAHAGADFIIETVADIPDLLPQIEARIAAGDRPGTKVQKMKAAQ